MTRILHFVDEQKHVSSPIHKLHPLAKLLCTLSFVIITVSFDQHNAAGLALMFIYPFVLFLISDVPFLRSAAILVKVLPFIILMGIFNPLIDSKALFTWGGFTVTSGMLSGAAFILKGTLSLLAAYLLIVTTGIEKISAALRMLHVPVMLVTLIMLIYRYIFMLTDEVAAVKDAYALRAPVHRGINPKAWGSLAGQVLIRSADRAEGVYDSMLLRGYKGTFCSNVISQFNLRDALYLTVWLLLFLSVRLFDLVSLLGGLFI